MTRSRRVRLCQTRDFGAFRQIQEIEIHARLRKKSNTSPRHAVPDQLDDEPDEVS